MGFFALLFLLISNATVPRTQKGADEFQLLAFILRFKGMQFLTGGVINGLMGATQYYTCVAERTCADRGPGGGRKSSATMEMYLELAEFALTVVLVGNDSGPLQQYTTFFQPAFST